MNEKGMIKFTNHDIFLVFKKLSERYGWNMTFGTDGWATIENELKKYVKKDREVSEKKETILELFRKYYFEGFEAGKKYAEIEREMSVLRNCRTCGNKTPECHNDLGCTRENLKGWCSKESVSRTCPKCSGEIQNVQHDIYSDVIILQCILCGYIVKEPKDETRTEVKK